MTDPNTFLSRLPRWFWPLASMLAGLVLGLLIGWIWWPVQWTNATIPELSPSAQAAYIAAVADAYVADGDPASAATLMAQRMAPLGDGAGDAIRNALAWHQAQPSPDAARINNLMLLAADWGTPIDIDTIAANAAAAPAQDVAPATDAIGTESGAESGTESGTESGAITVWGWLLRLLVSGALIGGGVYLYRQITGADKPGKPTARPPVTPTVQVNVARGGAAPASTPASQPAPAPAWKATAVKPAAGATVAPGDTLAFEPDEADDEFEEDGDDFELDDNYDDEDEAFVDDGGVDAPRPQQAGVPDARSGPGIGVRVAAGQSGTGQISPWSRPPAHMAGTRSSTPGNQPEGAPAAFAPVASAPVPPAARAATSPLAATAAPVQQPVPRPASHPPRASALSRLATAVSFRPQATKDANGKAPATSPAPVAASSKAPAPAPAPARPIAPRRVAPPAAPTAIPATRPPATATRPTTGQTPLATHTCHYFAGTPGYIEALNITDPRTGQYIGEFGMGVSLRNAALHTNPNQAIALEVWLTDNHDPTEYSNQARVLLSDFAAGKEYTPALLKDREGSVRTMMTRPGSRFSLEGRNLMLEGEIQEVQYDDQGIFRTVRVGLSIYAL